jgi:mannonate dehydratase
MHAQGCPLRSKRRRREVEEWHLARTADDLYSITMQMTFRWFGPADPIPLSYIRQIPGVRGIVSALYDVPVGDAWPRDGLARLAESVDSVGLELSVIESIPVHEDIKLGRPTRDRLIDQYAESVRRVGEIGVGVLCYNFMPVFDWTRTDLALAMDDGSTALAYDDAALARIDLSRGIGDLPGWATAYSASELAALLAAYRNVSEDQLWENLAYFLERVVPEAESANVKMAIHPDDPPWSIFGLPRIVTSGAALETLIDLVDRPANGVTFCTGSLGADPRNDLPAIVYSLGHRGRIHFAHCRNVRSTGPRQFHEAPHPSALGDVDMKAVLTALHETGFAGPMRPDHGRMIWGEHGRPGYGLHDRALGATYLYGLWEGVTGTARQQQ